MQKIVKWLDKNVANILAATIIGLAALLLFATIAAAGEPEPVWSESVIRLHILAADNSEPEQDLKLVVRDGIWSYISVALDGVDNRNDAREVIVQNLTQIEELAQGLVYEAGLQHNVTARLVQNVPFPNMVYGSIMLPASNYETLQIVIGEGSGENWWCIMFPTMCLTDVSAAEMIPENAEKVTLRPRFRIAELWQKR
ncbi:MAG: stage II sporulation protein R [Defluviitaleaceae bacterium]|nr:stage II sporulation protein R [Defluviitaleaceae bacterium]